MKSLFLVKSPLQLLNAVEARHHFGLDVSECILLIMGDRKSYPQMLQLVNASEKWHRVLMLGNINLFASELRDDLIHPGDMVRGTGLFSKMQKSSAFNVWRLNKIASHLGKLKYLFVGDYRNIYMRHFVNKVNSSKTVLLDDGTGTFQIANERSRKTDKMPVSLKKRLKNSAKRIFQGLMDKEVESLCFFTSYDISVCDGDSIERNDFHYLRSTDHSIDRCDQVYFLGGPVSESKTMPEDEYIEHMKLVKEYFSGEDLVYVAHRRESPEKLSRIQNEIGLTITLFEYPIEYQLALIGPRPKILASFYSSALENCRVIFGDSMSVIAFRLKRSDYPNQTTIDSIYNYYSTKADVNFKLVSLF